MCQLFASCFVQSATRISTNQSDEDWQHAPDSCQYMNLPISIWLYSTKSNFFYILKTSSVLIARDHAQNRSLTCGIVFDLIIDIEFKSMMINSWINTFFAHLRTAARQTSCFQTANHQKYQNNRSSYPVWRNFVSKLLVLKQNKCFSCMYIARIIPTRWRYKTFWKIIISAWC